MSLKKSNTKKFDWLTRILQSIIYFNKCFDKRSIQSFALITSTSKVNGSSTALE